MYAEMRIELICSVDQTIGNHTLALLDAPALVEEDYRRHGAQAKFAEWLGINGGSIDFVKNVATSVYALIIPVATVHILIVLGLYSIKRPPCHSFHPHTIIAPRPCLMWHP